MQRQTLRRRYLVIGREDGAEQCATGEDISTANNPDWLKVALR